MRPIPAEQASRYAADGWWTDDSIGVGLRAGLGTHAALPFVVHSRIRPWAGTLGDVLDLAQRLAGGLRQRGVGPGDVVSFQLPNWMEAAAAFYATAFLGAVVVPIVHFYGAKEVGYILRESAPRVHITAPAFGHQDFAANLASIDLADDPSSPGVFIKIGPASD